MGRRIRSGGAGVEGRKKMIHCRRTKGGGVEEKLVMQEWQDEEEEVVKEELGM